MNYRHIYHAGNFCDIIKHLTLIAILKNLLKKEKPFAALDCFAGIGLYNITSIEAIKTKESDSGVGKLLKALGSMNNIPELLKNYIEVILSTKNQNLYPGSPLIIKNFLRASDRLIACELHKEDFKTLQQVITNVHNLDAYLSLKAFLPFKEKRGLIFLDPAFEVRDEFQKLVNALKLIKQRASNICTLIWYPIKDLAQVTNFYEECKRVEFNEILRIEFSLNDLVAAPTYNSNDEPKYYVNSCGLLIVNPPYIQDELYQNISYLIKHVYNDQARFTINML